jgi:PTH1 family peptidyl-tRNA hydrolase
MWCVAGLGNPGRQYLRTRHNLGFMVADRLAAAGGAAWSRRSLYESARLRGASECLLVKPSNFMNLSGTAVARALRYHNLGAENLLVVCDDVDLDFGRLRLRAGGSSGGHRGLDSIIQCLGTQDFARLRMGIGRPGAPGRTPEHVLGRFAPEEAAALPSLVAKGAQAVSLALVLGIVKAMNEINRTTKEEPR